MKYNIIATAPTVYQLQSLNAFGMGYVKHLDGSFTASISFDSKEDAKDYLKGRADLWHNNNGGNLDEMYQEIIYSNQLRLDAVTAQITTA